MRIYLTADLSVRPTLEFRCWSVAFLQGVQVVQVVPEGEITIRGGTDQGTRWYRHFDEAPLVPPSPTYWYRLGRPAFALQSHLYRLYHPEKRTGMKPNEKRGR